MDCDFLKKLDTIGFPINFTHGSDERFRTKIGGFVTIVMGITFILLLWFLGRDDYLKLNPQSYSQLDPTSEDYKIDLNENPFLIGVKLSGLNKKIENIEKIFKPIFTFNKFFQETGIPETIQLNAITCDKIKIDKSIDINIFNLSSYYCPDFRGLNETIDGDFNSNKKKYIRVEISNCDKNGFCESLEEVDKAFRESGNQIIMNLLHPEVIYDKNNYEQPFKTVLDNRLNLLNPKIYPTEDIYFDHYKLSDQTTKKVLLMEERNFEVFGTNHLKYVTSYRPSDFEGYSLSQPEDLKKIKRTFYEVIIHKGIKKISYKRVYKTIINTLAEVNGIMSLLFYVLLIVVRTVSKFKFIQYMFSEIVIFNEYSKEEDCSPLKNKITIKSEKKEIIPEKNIFRRIMVDRKDNYLDNDDDEEEDIEIKQRNNRKSQENFLDIGGNNNYSKKEREENEKYRSILLKKFDKFQSSSNSMKMYYFYNCLNSSKKKEKKENEILFQTFKKKLTKEFDFFTYLQTNQKIRIIKNIIMNPIQYDLVDLISKKQYSLNKVDGDIKFDDIQNESNNLGKIVNYIINGNQLDDSNKEKLTRILDLCI